jgi:hypothetical protein
MIPWIPCREERLWEVLFYPSPFSVLKDQTFRKRPKSFVFLGAATMSKFMNRCSYDLRCSKICLVSAFQGTSCFCVFFFFLPARLSQKVRVRIFHLLIFLFYLLTFFGASARLQRCWIFFVAVVVQHCDAPSLFCGVMCSNQTSFRVWRFYWLPSIRRRQRFVRTFIYLRVEMCVCVEESLVWGFLFVLLCLMDVQKKKWVHLGLWFAYWHEHT